MMQVRAWRSRNRVQYVPVGESMTDQSQQMHSDVNYIVQRFARTGEWPKGRQGVFEDVTGLQRDLGERIRFVDEINAKLEAAAQAKASEKVVPEGASSDVPAES